VKNKILKTLIGIIIILILIISIIKINKTNKSSDLTKVKLAEVTHSAFYAPLYVAIENNYFEDYGLDVELILTSGADKVSAAVLSNDVNIGFAGPESAIYIYDGGEDDYLVTFSGLTKRDGQFIVSREKINNFTLKDLEGKEVLAGRLAGMPELNFVNALKNENIDSNKVNINTSVEFASLSGSFIAGMGDFVNLFEPNATNLVKEGYGYIVGSVGLYSGTMPYTAFYARKSYIEENEDTIKKFTNAINKGLQFVMENKAEDIAKAIITQFPDITIEDLTTIIDNYKQADTWYENSFISEEDYKNLEKIMIDNNLIDDYVPYDKLVKNYTDE
jgi:NitT/TauT family transport system substrate-binding protein